VTGAGEHHVVVVLDAERQCDTGDEATDVVADAAHTTRTDVGEILTENGRIHTGRRSQLAGGDDHGTGLAHRAQHV
jgi:hypothetical protein